MSAAERPDLWRLLIDAGGTDYCCPDEQCLAVLTAEKPHADLATVRPSNLPTHAYCVVCFDAPPRRSVA